MAVRLGGAGGSGDHQPGELINLQEIKASETFLHLIVGVESNSPSFFDAEVDQWLALYSDKKCSHVFLNNESMLKST
jgi:hypothetical protein